MRTTQIGGFYYRSGDHKRGMEFLTKGIAAMTRITSSPVPGFLRFCHFVDLYRNEKYEEALEEVSKMDMPRFWGVQAYTIAALAGLDLGDEIEPAKAKLLGIWPEFPTAGRTAIRNLIKEEDIANRLVADLQKSGIKLPND